MSKLYIPALALALVGGSASAQYGQTAPGTGSAGLSKVHTAADNARALRTRPTAPAAGARAAFYTEDFSGGAIPSGWTNVDDLTPVADDPVFFQWSNDPASVEPAALNYAPSETFNAPGASNGYLWANSDRGLASAPPTNHLTRLTTTAIDCSNQPSVLFTMQSLIGVFDNNANEFVKVRVSTDLTDWVDFFPFPCLETGAAAPPCTRWSDNPQSVAINITSVAANQPAVYLQFEWQGGWEYFWAIDDVELSPLPDNEIVMNYGYTSTTGLGEEYGRIPQSQLPEFLNVGAEVFNFGGLEQTNVVVNCSIIENAGGNEVLSSTTAVGTLASGASFIADENITLPDPVLPLGVYTATFTMTSDQIALDVNPDDNIRVRNFEVTNDIYALDNLGNYPAGITEVVSQTGSGSFLDNSENVKLLNMYYINAPLTVTGLEIGLGDASGPGSSIIISILDTLDALATPSVVNQPLAESDPYTLTQADVDAGVVTIPFLDPIELAPNAYYAVASLYSDGTNDVYVLDDATVPQPGLASALWIPFDPDANQNFYGGNGTAWAIRLTSNPNISVSEITELEGVTMYPNPTNGVLYINTTQSEKYTVEVMNMLGELVMTTKFTGMTTLDLATFADGVYSVRISNGTKATVQRVTLN